VKSILRIARISTFLFSGCLLATPVATQTGTVVSGTYSLNQDITSAYIVFSGTSGGNSTSGAIDTGDLTSTGGAQEAYSYTIPYDLGTGPIAFMGLDAAGGVVLTVDSGLAPSYAGMAWPYSETEAQIAGDIRSGNTTSLLSFLSAHSGDFFYLPSQQDATFLEYTNAQAIGTMVLTATPASEPHSILLVTLGGLLPFCGYSLYRRHSCHS
jgi:hypothetical protein